MPQKAHGSSVFSGLYRLSPTQRRSVLVERGFLSESDAQLLEQSGSIVTQDLADSMIENVIGVFELPIGLAVNFLVNGQDYVVPMVVEEPSIVAAVSHVAKLVRNAGGFQTTVDEPVMIGQIQIVGLTHAHKAAQTIRDAQQELIDIANASEPNMQKRGGGAQGLDVRVHAGNTPDPLRDMIVVHLHVDCRDAMGANLVNTMAEAVAPRIAELTGGIAGLRILSNLTDKRRARATCSIPIDLLAWKDFDGETVMDGILGASDFASRCPYRAATHNKGVMNGIDAAAIALGQDWRAIEAGAHAWMGMNDGYKPMATWHRQDNTLIGEIDIPMSVGIVGGPIRLHPTVQALMRLTNIQSAQELAGLLASVGLAQNLGALKALGTTGIQQGHMALHARSVAATAGATTDEIDDIAARLIQDGNIKVDRAAEILKMMRDQS